MFKRHLSLQEYRHSNVEVVSELFKQASQGCFESILTYIIRSLARSWSPQMEACLLACFDFLSVSIHTYTMSSMRPGEKDVMGRPDRMDRAQRLSRVEHLDGKRLLSIAMNIRVSQFALAFTN